VKTALRFRAVAEIAITSLAKLWWQMSVVQITACFGIRRWHSGQTFVGGLAVVSFGRENSMVVSYSDCSFRIPTRLTAGSVVVGHANAYPTPEQKPAE
jgi:hypothetical protein